MNVFAGDDGRSELRFVSERSQPRAECGFQITHHAEGPGHIAGGRLAQRRGAQRKLILINQISFFTVFPLVGFSSFTSPLSVAITKGDQLLPLPGDGAEFRRGGRTEGLLLQHLLLPQAVWRRWSPGGGTRCGKALDQSR